MDLKKYEKNVYQLNDEFESFKTSSILSLKSTLLSYFSTTGEKLPQSYWELHDEHSATELNTTYVAGYTQSIIYAHHFIELTIKQMLMELNENLVYDLSAIHLDLGNIAEGKIKITENENCDLYGMKTITFNEALSRVINLKKKLKYDLPKIENYKQPLNFLNKLRNSLWHKGTLIMDERDYEEYFGKYILGILAELAENIYEKEMFQIWHYGLLPVKIDPIKEIM